MEIDQKQGVNFGASWIKLIMHIVPSTHFVMHFSLTNCQKYEETMTYGHFFVLTDLSEIKTEKQQQKTNVGLGIIGY